MFLFFFLLLLFPFPARAADEFKITQNILYSVNSTGTANVRQEINLTNNFSQIYAREYQVNLSGTTLQNITGNDSFGNIIDQVKSAGENTTIFLKFSQPVIGQGQTNKFFLNYNIPEFAKKKGNTWEIQFPVFDKLNENQKTQIVLETPSSFGELSFASIPVASSHSLGDRLQISLNPVNPNNKILLVFGNHQIFDFNLNYFLKNTQNTTVITEIPLPPDTNYQDIVFKKINPEPRNVVADPDGNWLAQYELSPQQTLTVEVSGQAKVHPPHSRPTAIAPEKYLQPQSFWPVNDPQVSSLSQNLTTAKSIYQYVVNSLDYNYGQIDSAVRQGAVNALNRPQMALCTEFTDLFVTLARAKKIPAREIEGFAYSNNSRVKPLNVNSDVLHAWPEYYDSQTQTWIQIDPTWGKTTNGIDYFTDLDLNHLTFVIHGLSSDNPPPPGSYRNPQNDKSVFVDFATSEIKPSVVPPSVSIRDSKIIVKNQNLFSLNHFHLNQFSLDLLPPLSTSVFNLPPQNLFTSLTSKSYQFDLSYDESAVPIHQTIVNRSYYLYLSLGIGLAILILCFGGIIITASSKSHEKNS